MRGQRRPGEMGIAPCAHGAPAMAFPTAINVRGGLAFENVVATVRVRLTAELAPDERSRLDGDWRGTLTLGLGSFEFELTERKCFEQR